MRNCYIAGFKRVTSRPGYGSSPIGYRTPDRAFRDPSAFGVCERLSGRGTVTEEGREWKWRKINNKRERSVLGRSMKWAGLRYI